jgi:hypothetical protein
VAQPEESDLFDSLWVLASALMVGFVPLWIMLTAVMVMAGQVGVDEGEFEVTVEDDGSVTVVEAADGSWLLASLEAAAIISALAMVSAVGWGVVGLAQRLTARPGRQEEAVSLSDDARVRAPAVPAVDDDDVDRLVH